MNILLTKNNKNMDKTFAERYKESISGYTEEELHNELGSEYDSISRQEDRIKILCNERKLHDAYVSISLSKKRICVIMKIIDSKI